MSTSLNKEILGFNVPVNGVASSLSELAQLSGSEERALSLANNYILFHVHYTKIRSLIAETVESISGIKRLTKKSEKTGKDLVDESDEAYITRVEEELGEGSLNQFVAPVTEAVAKLVVDYTVTVRQPGAGGKLAKKWYDMYDQLEAQGKIEKLVAKHEIDLDGLDAAAARTVVAQKIKELSLKREQELKAQAQRELAASL